MNSLPLYVSVLEKDTFSTFVSSTLCNARSINMSVTSRSVVNTSTESALIVPASKESIVVFEMDTIKMTISDSHYKHIEVEQVYILKNILKSTMKDYTILVKLQS